MAYKIRYGRRRQVPADTGGALRLQSLTAFFLLICLSLVRIGWAFGAEKAAELLASEPRTVTERAVWAMAQALASGEGWYHGLAVWCETILRSAV